MALPAFLEEYPATLPSSHTDVPYIEAVRRSDRLSLLSHALWWPSRTDSTAAIAVLIPGNPGLAHFYAPFLTAVHKKCDGILPIVACGLVGHTPHIVVTQDPSSVSLSAQVEHLIDLVDAAASVYENVVLIGHSVGAWLSIQVLKARPSSVHSLFLLFPTIAHIASTPRGKALSWVFRPPMPWVVSTASYATRLIPFSVLSRLFSSWPRPQLLVLRRLLDSPSVIHAVLTMAHEEMVTVREPEVSVLQTFSSRIHLYYAANDGWVGEQKALILRALALQTDVKVVHGSDSIPHAFVINHSERVASQCHTWFLGAGLV